MKKRAYRSTLVKSVKVSEVVKALPDGPVWIGLDIAKAEVVAVLRDNQGQTLRPWKVKQPSEIRDLTQLLSQLAQTHEVKVAMESTGTYGDALRQALTDARLPVHLVSAKATHDFAEIMDGVPSQHDGKDATIVAELAAMGKSSPWPCPTLSTDEEELQEEVQWLDTQQVILQMWLGRLEALMARHWPEVTELLALDSATLLRTLMEYGGPQALAQDSEARQKLRRWGKRFLLSEKIEALLESARTTMGVRMTPATQKSLQRCAAAAQQARTAVRRTKASLTRRAKKHAMLSRMAKAVGPATACVLWAALGNPTNYYCGAAYRKAMGLNLKERSSGQHVGQLKITKRGSSMVRRWLFFAALRILQQEPVWSWYLKKKLKDGDRGGKAVIAVMRKLALAVYAVAKHDVPFDVARLFPGRPSPKSPRAGESILGALPPDPRDLSLSGQSRTNGAAKTRGLAPPKRSVPAPESALGSVPTGALSSAQVKQL
jgi:transposase